MFNMLLVMLLFGGGLFLFHEFCLRYVRLSLLVVVMMTLSLPFLEFDNWFIKVKTFSVLLPIVWLGVTRLAYEGSHHFLEVFRKNWVFTFLWIIVGLNIFELCIRLFEWGYYANALAGLILIITLVLPRSDNWRVGESPGFPFQVKLSVVWAALYTSWNLASFSGTYNFLYNVCLLSVPLFYSFSGRADLWLSARAYTLALGVFIMGYHNFISPHIDYTPYINDTVTHSWGWINLALHLGYLIYWNSEPKAKKIGTHQEN